MERDLGKVWELERKAKPLFLEMCIRGVPLDKGCWEGLTSELEDRVLSLKEKVDVITPPILRTERGAGTALRRPKKR